MPRLTCLPVFTPSTVTVVSSPMRSASPMRRVKIRIGAPSLADTDGHALAGHACLTDHAGLRDSTTVTILDRRTTTCP